jgi:hypothetical protein
MANTLFVSSHDKVLDRILDIASVGDPDRVILNPIIILSARCAVFLAPDLKGRIRRSRNHVCIIGSEANALDSPIMR